MAGEPKTAEEYIQKVLSDAEAQRNEKIMSHAEQHREFLEKKDHYGACLTFFMLLLGIVFFSYAGVKVISYFGPEVSSEEAWIDMHSIMIDSKGDLLAENLKWDDC